MKLSHLIRQKDTTVLTIGPDQRLTEAVSKMMEHRVGSLVVMEDGIILSIVTERDVMWTVNQNHDGFKDVRVRDVMAKRLVTCTGDDTVDHAMDLMINNPVGHRVRHLPVLDDKGSLTGLISIGDIVQALLTETKFENNLLKNYIKNWPEGDE